MRNVLITGGSQGIGRATAEMLRSEGYEVCTPNRQEMDLEYEDSVLEYLHKHRSDSYDVIINNAGINIVNEIENVSDDEIKRTMQINLLSPLCILRTFVSGMKERNYGRIVNIGSIWGVVSKPGRVTYSMTKHGIHGITATLAVELAKYNILVNTVCPGFTMTELTRKNNSPEQIVKISNGIPIKRMAEPTEIATIVSFLISEKNTYLTGQQIVVDGGFTMQ